MEIWSLVRNQGRGSWDFHLKKVKFPRGWKSYIPHKNRSPSMGDQWKIEKSEIELQTSDFKKIESCFVSPFWFLILAREPVIRPRGTVDVIVSIFVRIGPSTLPRKMYGFVFIHFREAFPNFYRFGGSDPRVSVDGRPRRIKKYTDSNESA